MNVPTVTSPVNPSVRYQSPAPSTVSPPITPKPVPNDDALNDYLIDHAYRLMKSAVTEDSRLHWGERLAHYTRRRFSEVEKKKALGVVS